MRLAWRGGAVAVVWLAIAAVPATAAQPTIVLSATSGKVGDQIAITGTGWPAGEVVGLYIDKPQVYMGVPGPRADAQGAFKISVQITPAAPGLHSICADTSSPNPQAVAAKVCTPFTVVGTAALSSPSPTQGGSAGPSIPAIPAPVAAVIVVALGAIAYFLVRRSR